MLIFVNSICFPEVGNEGSGIFVYEQCKELLRLGNEVVILYPTYKSIKEADCFQKTNVKLLRYKEFDVYRTMYTWISQDRCPILSAIVYLKYLKKCYKKAIKKYGTPDVIYSHFSLNAGFGAVMIGKKFTIPVVAIEHFSGFIKGKINKRNKYLLNTVIDNSEQFLCVSDNLKNEVIRLTDTKRNLFVLPDMVNDVFKYYEKEHTEEFIFFSVGGLIERKNFHLLISLFCKAFLKTDKVKLKIAGEGIERIELEKLINDIYNRKDQIILCGALNRNDLLVEYKKSDAFILLSKKETFGIVYREAMCVGKPVISSRNGGIEYNWEDAYGILVNEKNENEVIDALKKMVKNIDNYNSRYISNDTIKKYSSEKIGTQLQKILEESIENFKSI